MARAEQRRRRRIVVVVVEFFIETLDFGLLSLREDEARPQAGDALGKSVMLFFFLCEKERHWKPSRPRERGFLMRGGS